ncbi:MAG: hypothetical protein RL208_350 [Pseudomonadota bacterium]|jgi:hypothetical protein
MANVNVLVNKLNEQRDRISEVAKRDLINIDDFDKDNYDENEFNRAIKKPVENVNKRLEFYLDIQKDFLPDLIKDLQSGLKNEALNQPSEDSGYGRPSELVKNDNRTFGHVVDFINKKYFEGSNYDKKTKQEQAVLDTIKQKLNDLLNQEFECQTAAGITGKKKLKDCKLSPVHAVGVEAVNNDKIIGEENLNKAIESLSDCFSGLMKDVKETSHEWQALDNASRLISSEQKAILNQEEEVIDQIPTDSKPIIDEAKKSAKSIKTESLNDYLEQKAFNDEINNNIDELSREVKDLKNKAKDSYSSKLWWVILGPIGAALCKLTMGRWPGEYDKSFDLETNNALLKQKESDLQALRTKVASHNNLSDNKEYIEDLFNNKQEYAKLKKQNNESHIAHEGTKATLASASVKESELNAKDLTRAGRVNQYMKPGALMKSIDDDPNKTSNNTKKAKGSYNQNVFDYNLFRNANPNLLAAKRNNEKARYNLDSGRGLGNAL